MNEGESERVEGRERKTGRDRERETCLRIGDSFVLCLCMPVWECWGVIGAKLLAFLLISTYSRNANNNSILTRSLEVTVLSECSPGLLRI